MLQQHGRQQAGLLDERVDEGTLARLDLADDSYLAGLLTQQPQSFFREIDAGGFEDVAERLTDTNKLAPGQLEGGADARLSFGNDLMLWRCSARDNLGKPLGEHTQTPTPLRN